MPPIFSGNRLGRLAWLLGLAVGCARNPEKTHTDLELALAGRAAQEAAALAGDQGAVLLPVVDPDPPGAPPLVPAAWEVRVRRECERAGVRLEVLRLPGPARFAESEDPIPAEAFFRHLAALQPPPVVLMLIPVPSSWRNPDLSDASGRGVRWVLADTTRSEREHWPEGFPDVGILPRDTPLPEARSEFDRFYEIVRSAP